MMLFLDTEWSQGNVAEGCHLVSIALVGHDSRYQFYAERDLLPANAPDFVRSVVYPLLERGDHAMPDAVLCQALRAFIATVTRETGGTPTIAADYGMDKVLFIDAWAGLDDTTVESVGPPPVSWFDLNRLNPHYTIGLESFFEGSPENAKRRHNALVDALAARAGYMHAVRKIAMEGKP